MPRRAQSFRRHTAKEIDEYIKDGGTVAPLHDGGGLYLRKLATGWYWYLRATSSVTAKPTWISLCDGVAYPNASLKDARAKADELRNLNGQGKDILEERRRTREEERTKIEVVKEAKRRQITIRGLFDEWKKIELVLVNVKGERKSGRKDSGMMVEALFNLHIFPSIGKMQAVAVERRHVVAILDRLRLAGTMRTANVALSLVRQMFRFGIRREFVKVDPTYLISKKEAGGSDAERERVLSEHEIRQLAGALPKSGLTIKAQAAIWITLSTCCRIGEICNARWQDVNVLERTWIIPAAHSKNGRSHVIHLSDFAIARFDELKAAYPHEIWVLPNVRRDGPIDSRTINKQLQDRQRDKVPMRNRSQQTDALLLPDGQWKPHDLRRTGATLMGDLGISGDVIERCLNHTETNTLKRIYQRSKMMDERKEAFEKLSIYLSDIYAAASS